MKEIFKQLIIDFHKESIPTFYPRELTLPQLPSTLKKAFVFIGMRRSGKTWTLYQIIQNLIEEQVIDFKKIVYINFEDDRLAGVQLSDLQSLLDAYYELYPTFSEEKLHFFFDEIHEVEDWEKFIRRLLDKENIQLYLTGSSAKQLSKEIASTLRGRNLVREIFPFNFKEYLTTIGIQDTLENPSSKQKAQLLHHLNHFLVFGGFPETLKASPEFHRELLQGYMDSVIYRDIMERYNISQGTLLRSFLRFCLHNAAGFLSIHKMYQSFKSQGFVVGKNTLYEFMDYFEDAYCLFTVPIFDFSDRKTSLKPKKIYPVDQGLITAFTLKKEFDQAARLETAVFTKLRRETEELYYYQTRTGKEIDFLKTNPQGNIELYQVCLNLSQITTKDREISALAEAMSELKLSTGVIVTLEEEGTIEIPKGTIALCPAWKFLT